MLGPVGQFGVYVGPMLDHVVGNVVLHGGAWTDNLKPNRKRLGWD